MKIFVCAKQVPDLTAGFAMNPDGTLDRSRMESVTNPDDLRATEAALVLKEQFGCSVTVVTMGPPQSEEMLRELLAMGADDAVLVTGRPFAGSDTYATARILAAALRTVGFGPEDVVLCGQQAIDGDTAQVGPELAEQLGIPQITFASAIDADEEGFTVRSLTDTGYRVVRAEAPCLICCMNSLNKPRYMPVSGIFSAYDKPLTILGPDELNADPPITAEDVGLPGSPTNSLVTFPPAKRKRGTFIDGSERTIAEQLAAILKENRLLSAEEGGAR